MSNNVLCVYICPIIYIYIYLTYMGWSVGNFPKHGRNFWQILPWHAMNSWESRWLASHWHGFGLKIKTQGTAKLSYYQAIATSIFKDIRADSRQWPPAFSLYVANIMECPLETWRPGEHHQRPPPWTLSISIHQRSKSIKTMFCWLDQICHFYIYISNTHIYIIHIYT